MTDLTTRVRQALGDGRDNGRSPWADLMGLYETDREAFYLLALAGEQAEDDIERLGFLARWIAKAVRVSYRLTPPTGGEGHVEAAGDRLAVPADLFPRVQRFLLDIDGKGASASHGKDYEGRPTSEAEVRFKLGAADPTREREIAKKRDESRPQVFKLATQDLGGLKSQPAYVTHNLFRCARKVLLAPTAIYRGLQRGNTAPLRLREGWAICGKPNRACDNDGRALPAPPGMLFVVYADAYGFVFDWDWVQEDEHAPGHPLDEALRFGNPVPITQEMVLDLPDSLPDPKFDANVATYSDRGDCIFCYICDECGYAERVNPDLTIFRDFENKEVTGFKIKNVRRILKEEEEFVSDDAPDLMISVQTILLATLRANRGTSLMIYDLIIRAFRKVPSPPEIHLPQPESSDSELAEV